MNMNLQYIANNIMYYIHQTEGVVTTTSAWCSFQSPGWTSWWTAWRSGWAVACSGLTVAGVAWPSWRSSYTCQPCRGPAWSRGSPSYLTTDQDKRAHFTLLLQSPPVNTKWSSLKKWGRPRNRSISCKMTAGFSVKRSPSTNRICSYKVD